MRVFILVSVLSLLFSQTLSADDDGVAVFHAPSHHPRLLITFGDSLSDARNYFIENQTFTVRPFDEIPTEPYLIGGLHFTNGKTWIEQLAQSIGSFRSALPSLAVPGFATDYAVGRARARSYVIVEPNVSNLTEQVDSFLSDFDDRAPSKAFYLVWIGTNDVRDALEAFFIDPSGETSELIVREALTAILNNALRLHEAGAQKFLVLNAPDLAITPAINVLGPEIGALATQLSIEYNDRLEEILLVLEVALGIEIKRLDVFALLDEVVADPERFGLTNVADSCITPDVIVGAICDDPDGYLFWDSIHPTRKTHGILAEAAQRVLFSRAD